MFSLLRNKIDKPSYKRGLMLTGFMLFFYGLAFQIHAVKSLAPDILEYALWASLGLAIITSFRAMAERRVLRETHENYVPMIDPSIIPTRWQIAAVGGWVLIGAVVYVLSLGNNPLPIERIIFFGLPMGLFVLGAAYVNAAKRWSDDPH